MANTKDVAAQAQKIANHYLRRKMSVDAISVCLERIKLESQQLHDAVEKVLDQFGQQKKP